jgi:hypothetical protein
LEQDHHHRSKHTLTQGVQEKPPGIGGIEILVDALKRPEPDPNHRAERKQQHVSVQIEEKDALERKVGAREVGQFERQDGEDGVCYRKQQLNSFSMVRKHRPNLE